MVPCETTTVMIPVMGGSDYPIPTPTGKPGSPSNPAATTKSGDAEGTKPTKPVTAAAADTGSLNALHTLVLALAAAFLVVIA
jgi:hypothetical protein